VDSEKWLDVRMFGVPAKGHSATQTGYNEILQAETVTVTGGTSYYPSNPRVNALFGSGKLKWLEKWLA
jgi:hypothetical protein